MRRSCISWNLKSELLRNASETVNSKGRNLSARVGQADRDPVDILLLREIDFKAKVLQKMTMDKLLQLLNLPRLLLKKKSRETDGNRVLMISWDTCPTKPFRVPLGRLSSMVNSMRRTSA